MHSLKYGILIAIEGIDGSGKSTLARALHHALNQSGFSTLLTHEPGKTELGRKIRTVLHKKTVPICSEAEYLLFAADRAQHFYEYIVPNLKQNKLIISDRMADSSVVYQGYGRGLSIEKIQYINSWIMNGIQPNITVYIRISPKNASKRIQIRSTEFSSFEQENKKFIEKLVTGFDILLSKRPSCIILDGMETKISLYQKAVSKIISWIHKNDFLQ